jgi:hypothetical protein
MTLADLVFFAAISMLLLHEMDAIDKKEWRLLFVLRRLPDEGAMRWFIVLHLPLLIALLILVAAGASTVMRWIEGGVDTFLIVHAGLHQRLSRHGHNAFHNAFSRSLIWGSASLGVIHLMILGTT